MKSKDKPCEIIGPVGGWKDQSYYEVEVSMRDSNPIFNGVLYTGFLGPEGLPGGYSFIVSPGSDYIDLHRTPIRFLRAIKLISTHSKTSNTYKLPGDKDVLRDPSHFA